MSIALTSTEPGRALTVWLTGLSGAGKSTLAFALGAALRERRMAVSVLDGDVVRTGLCRDLGFSERDRHENIRRVAEAARLLNEAGVTVVCSLISPLRADRAMARDIVGADRFVEVHVSTPLAVCEVRDPKGLYRKAREGVLKEFTGISAPYEEPPSPSLSLDTSRLDTVRGVQALLDCMATQGRVGS